jgi:hypothetical protein
LELVEPSERKNLVFRRRRCRNLRFFGFSVEHLQVGSDHLSEISFLAFVLELVRLQPPFDVNQTSLVQVFPADISQPSPCF